MTIKLESINITITEPHNEKFFKLQSEDIGISKDRDGLYTWCSRISDRITSQA